MMKLWGNKDSGPYSVSADCLPLTLQSFMSSSRLSIVTSTNICITFSTFSCIVLSCLSKQFCQISNITLSCRKLWTVNITFCLRVMKVTEERTCVISSWQVLSENWQLLEAWEAAWYIGQRARPAGSGVSFLCRIITRARVMQQGASDWNCSENLRMWARENTQYSKITPTTAGKASASW